MIIVIITTILSVIIAQSSVLYKQKRRHIKFHLQKYEKKRKTKPMISQEQFDEYVSQMKLHTDFVNQQQTEKINELLESHLKKEGRKSLFQGIVVSVVFFILGFIVNYLILRFGS